MNIRLKDENRVTLVLLYRECYDLLSFFNKRTFISVIVYINKYF